MSSKGIIVIPKEVREAHGLKKGSKFVVLNKLHTIVLVPIPDDPLAALEGIAKGKISRERLRELSRE